MSAGINKMLNYFLEQPTNMKNIKKIFRFSFVERSIIDNIDLPFYNQIRNMKG